MGKMKVGEFYRHGDVYIVKSKMNPTTIRTGKKNDSPVLAYGEVTGHKHEMMDCAAFERYEIDGKTFLIVGKSGVSITHEEHGLGIIAAGVYEVTIDREYDYLYEMSRNVAD